MVKRGNRLGRIFWGPAVDTHLSTCHSILRLTKVEEDLDKIEHDTFSHKCQTTLWYYLCCSMPCHLKRKYQMAQFTWSQRDTKELVFNLSQSFLQSTGNSLRVKRLFQFWLIPRAYIMNHDDTQLHLYDFIWDCADPFLFFSRKLKENTRIIFG